eukprot:5038410-Amphidinium_carterae.1
MPGVSWSDIHTVSCSPEAGSGEGDKHWQMALDVMKVMERCSLEVDARQAQHVMVQCRNRGNWRTAIHLMEQWTHSSPQQP